MKRFSATGVLHFVSITIIPLVFTSKVMLGFTFRPCYAFLHLPTRSICRGVRTSATIPNVNRVPLSIGYKTFYQPTHFFVRFLFQLNLSNPPLELSDSDSTKAKILFLGTPEVAASSLQSIFEHSQTSSNCPYQLVGVVTQPPKRRKRGGSEIPSPVGFIANELGLPTFCPESARDVTFLEMLETNVKPDLCITAAYGQYLPKRFLSLPKYGTLNIHPSLLPRWRGSSPVQRSLEAGDDVVGVSVLFTVSKMDAGPIVSQHSINIDENEQATTLLPKLFDIGTEALLKALPKVIEGSITMDTAREQDDSLVMEAKMIESSEGQLHPETMSALQCHNRIRGFSMWPGTYIYVQIGDEGVESVKEPVKMKVIESRVIPGTVEPTNVVEIGPRKGDGLRLVCSDGSVLEMLKVQPATRNVMDAKSFVNGLQGQRVRWLSVVDKE